MRAEPTIAKAARALKRRARTRFPAARDLPAMVLMSDSERLADPIAVLDRLPRGAAVIFRHYAAGNAGDGAHARLSMARQLLRACRMRGLRLLVAGDIRLALNIGADGVHLPEWQLRRTAGPVRRPRRGFIVTAACHSSGALARAASIGADAALLAPVFANKSHPGAPFHGALRFAHMVRAARLPVFALGGIDTAGVRRIKGSGAAGVAGIGFAAAHKP